MRHRIALCHLSFFILSVFILTDLKAQQTFFDSIEPNFDKMIQPQIQSEGQMDALVPMSTSAYDPRQYSSGPFPESDVGPCPPAGKGNGDPALSLLKNRDLPAPHYSQVTVSQLIAHNFPVARGFEVTYTRAKRSTWPTAVLGELQKFESQGVYIEGYFLCSAHESTEHCNCESSVQVDNHTWLIDSNPHVTAATALAKLRSGSTVAEISPRLHGHSHHDHPNYTYTMVNRIARNGLQVRVFGWLTWDEEHKEQLGKTRGTLWEVHPIHDIKVNTSRGWVDLDELTDADLPTP